MIPGVGKVIEILDPDDAMLMALAIGLRRRHVPSSSSSR